ncbi:uncharacterized protein LOC129585419 [Paramacrobiotus metropolitanus]|uniref:uncharacterized protein LOC129585419 n=1 Tax=Paramacrobiotus metropolitanus TaxID=2943436 RepID=UPI0024457153|nr:uncharacterized protein LOC129585419 [Paramacrobiotus metropolitanus]
MSNKAFVHDGKPKISTMLRQYVTINGVSLPVVFDTAASTSIMPGSFCSNLHAIPKPLPKLHLSFSVTGCNGVTRTVGTTCADIYVSLFGEPYRHTIFLRDDNAMPEIILGMDFMEKKPLQIRCQDRTIVPEQAALPTDYQADLHERSSSSSTGTDQQEYSVSTETESAQSQRQRWRIRVIPSRTPFEPSGHPQHNDALSRGDILLEHAIVTVHNGTAYTFAKNYWDRGITLRGSTSLGTLELYAENSDAPVLSFSVDSNPAAADSAYESVSPVLEEQLRSVIISPRLTASQRDRLFAVLRRRCRAFPLPGRPVGCTTATEHTIKTGDSPPVHQQPYRTSWTNRAFIREKVAEMKGDGIIADSTSPYAAPVVLVDKFENEKMTKRFCVNYKDLNAHTVKDAYPMSRIADEIDAIGPAAWFVTLV